MPVDRILQAVRDYLEEEEALLECAPDPVSRPALTSGLRHAHKTLREALADYEAWRIRGRAFHRVLAGVDYDERSAWAAQVAGKIAGEEDAAVCLVHVVQEPVGVSTEMGYYARPDITRELRTEGEALLRRTREQLPRSVRPRVEERLHEGDSARGIVAAAEEWRADLIVLGTHGRGALGRLLMGGTADWVFRHAPCPVLVVRRDPDDVAEEQLGIEALEQAGGRG